MSIVVLPHDQAWPEIFEQISGQLRSALAGLDVLGIEHVGSTAVPDLAAKPVIDIDVVVEADEVVPAVAALERLGYVYRGMRGVVDRHVFRAPPGVEPQRHVYLVVAGSLALRNHLTVKDVLLESVGMKDRYSELKFRLADKSDDPETYTTSKSDFIDEILAQGGLSESERWSVRIANSASLARRVGEDAVVTDDGMQLWVEERGAVDGTPVVLCHGGPGVADYLEPLRDLLVELGMRVVRWDQRGAGRSDKHGPYSVERFVADLEAVRQTVVGGRCWLVGHSWGANLALAHAQMHATNLQGVVYLCGTGLEWWPIYTRRHKQRQAERLGPELGERMNELRDKKRTRREDQEYQLLYLRSELADPDNVRLAGAILQEFSINHAVNAAINEEVKGWDLSLQKSRCRAVMVPVSVIHGEADPRPSEAVDSLVEALPLASRRTLEGVGHWPWIEQPEPTGRLFKDVLTSVAQGGVG
jgi:proline iminopeptidase